MDERREYTLTCIPDGRWVALPIRRHHPMRLIETGGPGAVVGEPYERPECTPMPDLPVRRVKGAAS